MTTFAERYAEKIGHRHEYDPVQICVLEDFFNIVQEEFARLESRIEQLQDRTFGDGDGDLIYIIPDAESEHADGSEEANSDSGTDVPPVPKVPGSDSEQQGLPVRVEEAGEPASSAAEVVGPEEPNPSNVSR